MPGHSEQNVFGILHEPDWVRHRSSSSASPQLAGTATYIAAVVLGDPRHRSSPHNPICSNAAAVGEPVGGAGGVEHGVRQAVDLDDVVELAERIGDDVGRQVMGLLVGDTDDAVVFPPRIILVRRLPQILGRLRWLDRGFWWRR